MVGAPSVMLSFVMAIIVTNCAHWAATGRIVDTRCTHVGARPASDGRDDWAMTLQITTDYPECP
jgi:hypothetical protein